MNMPDQEIDKLLAALNHAQPSPGMEIRILQRLKQPDRRRIAPPWTKRFLWAGAAAMASIALAFFVHPVGHHVPSTPFSTPATGSVAVVAQSTPAIAPARSSQKRLDEGQTQSTTERLRRSKERFSAIQTPYAAQTDTRAVSFPAPPMPLTAQEQLLLRIATRGESRPVTPPPSLSLGTELATLRQETDTFFQDPNTGENQWKQIVAQQAAK